VILQQYFRLQWQKECVIMLSIFAASFIEFTRVCVCVCVWREIRSSLPFLDRLRPAFFFFMIRVWRVSVLHDHRHDQMIFFFPLPLPRLLLLRIGVFPAHTHTPPPTVPLPQARVSPIHCNSIRNNSKLGFFSLWGEEFPKNN